MLASAIRRAVLILPLFSCFAALLYAQAESPAGRTKEEKITRARSAAPDSISADVTVVDMDGTVLAEGTNGWTCLPGSEDGKMYPMCNDETWVRLMDAIMNQKPFETDRIGISYMLQGDANVSNSDPYATDPENGDVWVKEGPHLMIVVPKEMLAGLSDDPYNGGPYVMWKDTPYAHIMVPVPGPDGAAE